MITFSAVREFVDNGSESVTLFAEPHGESFKEEEVDQGKDKRMAVNPQSDHLRRS